MGVREGRETNETSFLFYLPRAISRLYHRRYYRPAFPRQEFPPCASERRVVFLERDVHLYGADFGGFCVCGPGDVVCC